MDPKFQTKHAIEQLLTSLTNKGTVTSEDTLELKSHLLDSITQLEQLGLTSQEAFEVARLRLGTTEEVAVEYEKVNGSPLLGKEWIFICIGISLAIIISNLLQFSQLLLGSLTATGKLRIETAGIVLCCVYLLLIFSTILLFKKGPQLVSFFRSYFFQKNSLPVTLLAVTAGFLAFFPLSNIVPPGSYNAIRVIINTNRAVEIIVLGTTPFLVFFLVFFALRSAYQPVSLATLFNGSNYIHIVLLSLGIETVTAILSRGLFTDAWFSPYLFGVLLLLQTISFINYNKNQPHLLLKTSMLLLIPFIVEVGASILRISTNWIHSPLFGFAVATITVTIGSLLLTIRIKRKLINKQRITLL